MLEIAVMAPYILLNSNGTHLVTPFQVPKNCAINTRAKTLAAYAHNNHAKDSENCHITSCCPDRHMTAMRQGGSGVGWRAEVSFLQEKKV